MTLDERNFNSRTSCEVRLAWKRYRQGKAEFQLTHLLRGATVATQNAIAMTAISTHAPLARCDPSPFRRAPAPAISTHAPLARCDGSASTRLRIARRFQLTHLLRGATRRRRRATTSAIFQLTHLLRGATAIYCSTFISQTHHLVRGGQVNQIIDLSGVKYCPVLARTGNDFCIIHGSLKHYKIIGPSGS